MVVSEIKLYKLLKAKIGEREAEAFIQIHESKVETKLNEKIIVFSTKEDLAKVEGKLLSTISESKIDIIKWMVATAIAIVGLIVALIKMS
ncbi:MAG: hypothetical protein WKG06_29035 [Segetibacter sp.]